MKFTNFLSLLVPVSLVLGSVIGAAQGTPATTETATPVTEPARAEAGPSGGEAAPDVATPLTATPVTRSEPWDRLHNGPCTLYNNTWGAPADEDLESSVFLNADKTMGWSWQRNQARARPGDASILPLYPNVRIGGSPWEKGNITRFPLRWGDVSSLQLSVSYRYDQLSAPTGKYDLAYDFFLTDSDQPANKPTLKAEVMIWLHGTMAQPAQHYKGVFSDGANAYSLYAWTMKDGRLYYSFLLNQPPKAEGEFTVNASRLVSAIKLDPKWYLHGLEFGNEVWDGEGKITLDRFAVTINGDHIE